MKLKKSTTIFRSIATLLMVLIIGGWFSQPAAAQRPIRIGCNTDLLIDGIIEANGNNNGLDVIELAPNCTYPMRNHNVSDVSNGLPVIIEPLRIEGNGAKLLGPENDGPRHIHAKAALTLVDMTLENGASATRGGAILTEADLTLTEVILRNNFSNNGGAVYAQGPLTVSGGQFSKNKATFFGGAIYADGSLLNLSNTTLFRNEAGNGGGSIFTTAPTTISNSQIDRSKANLTTTDVRQGCGGGIRALGPLTLNQNLIGGNQASRGGGVCASNTLTASGNLFTDNTATLQGGGLYSANVTTLLHNTFLRNEAKQIGSGLTLVQRTGRSQLINNVWLEQQGPAEVMCLFCVDRDLGQEVIILHNTIANAESRSIDAIVVRNGRVNLVNSIITNHKVGIRQVAGQVQTSRNLYFGNGQDELGTISSENNHLTANPGFVNPAKGIYRLQADSPAVGQALVDPSPAMDRRGVHRPQGNGPDIGAYEFDEGLIPASHVLTPGCDAGELVGAVEQANAVIGAHRIELAAGCTYTLNRAAGRDLAGTPTGLPAIIDYLVIAGNGATIARNESAPDFRLLAADNATLMMENLTVQNGRTVDDGAGLFVNTIEISGEQLDLTNVTLRNNVSTDDDGGGIYVQGSRATIRGSTFENNQASSGGGLLSGSHSQLRLIDTTFRNNTAEREGGGISAYNRLQVSDTVFINNAAAAGGGIYAQDRLTLTQNTFSQNRAPVGAGLLYKPIQSDNLIANNLWVDHATTAEAGSAVITLQGFIADDPGTVDLYHNTIVNATLSAGSGVHIEAGLIQLYNNIIANYQSPFSLVASTLVRAEAEHNLTFTETSTNLGQIDAQNNIVDNPRFVDPATGNYRLQAGSPAIDTGTDVGLTVDLEGEARPFGPGFDMGAYEFRANPQPGPGGDFTVFLPLVVK